MKRLTGFLFICGLFSACDPSGITNARKEQRELASDSTIHANLNQVDSVLDPSELFTTNDASRIMGEETYFTDSSTTRKDGEWLYQSFYGNKVDTTVYFLFEQFDEVASAINKYAFMRTSNEEQEGMKEYNEVGDEAYFYTDNKSYYFMMVRKADTVITIKINKMTRKTSIDELHRVVKEIASEL